MQLNISQGRHTRAAALTLVALESMACGCVVAIYRANPTVVEVELVEAKGPHCRFYGHRSGQVIALGSSGLPSPEGREPRV